MKKEIRRLSSHIWDSFIKNISYVDNDLVVDYYYIERLVEDDSLLWASFVYENSFIKINWVIYNIKWLKDFDGFINLLKSWLDISTVIKSFNY